MKRFHVHIRVSDLAQNINFYTKLFAIPPTVSKADYAKWVLPEPAINFALSTHGEEQGISHIGIEFDSEETFVQAMQSRETQMSNLVSGKLVSQEHATCCYAQSQKQWLLDPQEVPWEFFFSHDTMDVYGTSDTRASIMAQDK